MGAFFLYKKDADINLEAVKSHFVDKGFRNPIIRNFGSYSLWLYKKILVDEDNFLEDEECSIYSIGTVIYKRQDYRASLKKILYDFIRNSIDYNELIGSFFLLINKRDQYYILTDLSNTQNVYYHINTNVISSSFLAVIYASHQPLKLDNFAITEILTTGNLISPDTTIKEIKRLLIQDSENFEGIQALNQLELKKPEYCNENYEDCLIEQIELLEDYFKAIQNFADKYGISSGLTGGLDSRLLLVLITKHLNNFQFFTTWRKSKSKDFLIAEKVAKTAGQELIVIPVTDPLDMNEEQALETLNQSFIFFDGLVRTHHLWVEEINTRSYRETLLKDNRISLSGVGGEQYRNQERIIFPKRNLMDWVEYELVYRHSGDCFSNKNNKQYFLEYLGKKIKTRLNIHDRKYIDHLIVKRYYNEIYNPANRTIRMNIENQIAFFLSPYTEFKISHNAYKIIPYLGTHLKFEADMIKKLSPTLAAIETHYGSNLLKGESFNMQLYAYIKELLPSQIFYKLYQKRKPSSRFYYEYENRFPFVNNNTKLLSDLNLPIDITKLKGNSFLNPLIISLGYFLEVLNKKINF